MFSRFASINPLRLLDEGTTQLGDWLLDLVPRVGALLRSLTVLPAGIQIVLVIGTLVALGLSFMLMRKAFLDARAIRQGVREARDRSRAARADLALRDRRKAFGYVMFIGVAIVAVILAVFVYQSIVHAGGNVPPRRP